MKAAIFEKPGLDNLKVDDSAEKPKHTDHDVLVRVNTVGVNPRSLCSFRCETSKTATTHTGSRDKRNNRENRRPR